VAGAGERRGGHTGVCWGNLRERGLPEDLGIDGSIIIKNGPSGSGVGRWTGLSWLRIGKGGWRLCMRL